MKSDPVRSKAPGASTSRAPYTTYGACHPCQKKKKRCVIAIMDEGRAICRRCKTSGVDCTWASEIAKVSCSQAYVDGLLLHIKRLEADAARCHEEHGGFGDSSAMFSMPSEDQALEIESETTSEEEPDIERLWVPTKSKQLVLEEDNDELQLASSFAIFRLEPKMPGRASRFPQIFENPDLRYVLFLEGIDESQINPNLDWSRHLPSEVPITRKEHDRLLDLLFKFFTSWCLRIVPVLFLRDMCRSLSTSPLLPPPKTPHYSPMLHNALVALAMGFSDDMRLRDLNSRQYFARKAKSYIETDCQKPNISALHALSILASFHSSQGDRALGYMYFGMCVRISQALGLSIDCSPWVKSGLITHDDMLDRNWAHWTTFSQDVCWSFYVGREFCVPTPLNHQNIPVPFVDSEYDQIPWHHPASGWQAQPNYLSSTFAETCGLLRIAKRIMDVINGLSIPGARREVNYSLIGQIDIQLKTWRERLPPEVNITPSNRSTALPHRLMLHLTYRWCFILLHRPFYHRDRAQSTSENDLDDVKICNNAAENIMKLLGTWRSLYTLRYVPITLIQIVFSAGTVFLLAASRAMSGSRLAAQALAESLSQVELCIQYLSESGRSWDCANHIGGILGTLLEQLKPRIESVKKLVGRGPQAGQTPVVSGRVEPAFPPPAGPMPPADNASVWVSPPGHAFPSPISQPWGRNTGLEAGPSQLGVNQSPNGLGGDGAFGGDGMTAFGIFDFTPGMPGGSTLSAPSFMAFGDSAGLNYVNAQQTAAQGNEPWSASELTQEEVVTLQQYWNPQHMSG